VEFLVPVPQRNTSYFGMRTALGRVMPGVELWDRTVSQALYLAANQALYRAEAGSRDRVLVDEQKLDGWLRRSTGHTVDPIVIFCRSRIASHWMPE
jgi:hypothetical protein